MDATVSASPPPPAEAEMNDNETPEFFEVWKDIQKALSAPKHWGRAPTPDDALGRESGPTYTLRGRQRFQQAKLVGLREEHLPMLENRELLWKDLQDYVNCMECIAIFDGRILLVSRQPQDIHADMLELGSIYVTTAMDPSTITDGHDVHLLTQLLAYFHKVSSNTNVLPRFDLWKSIRWSRMLMDLGVNWNVACFMGCTDLPVDLMNWVTEHAAQIMIISESTIQDGGVEFANTLAESPRCTVTNLVLDSKGFDMNVINIAVQSCSTLRHIFLRRSEGPAKIDRFVQAVQRNSGLHDVHVFGNDYDLADWRRWLIALIKCQHLATLRYEFECGKQFSAMTEEQKDDLGKAILDALRPNKTLCIMNFYHGDTVKSSAWDEMKAICSVNSRCRPIYKAAKTMANKLEHAWILDALFRQESVRNDVDRMFTAIRESTVILAGLRYEGAGGR